MVLSKILRIEISTPKKIQEFYALNEHFLKLNHDMPIQYESLVNWFQNNLFEKYSILWGSSSRHSGKVEIIC